MNDELRAGFGCQERGRNVEQKNAKTAKRCERSAALAYFVSFVSFCSNLNWLRVR
jgi:hypothetical protein